MSKCQYFKVKQNFIQTEQCYVLPSKLNLAVNYWLYPMQCDNKFTQGHQNTTGIRDRIHAFSSVATGKQHFKHRFQGVVDLKQSQVFLVMSSEIQSLTKI